MNFIELHIHNIASIADAVIRFDDEPFASNPLFLIYGPTGSGKTTLLDSICLALYDAAPRLDSLNQKKRQYEDVFSNKGVRNVNDVSNLIRNGATDSFINLTFMGNDTKIYTAGWVARFGIRGSAKGKLLDIDRTLSVKGSDMIWEKKSDIEKIISSPEVVGLSYDNFLRTTILPQGAFNRFLSAGRSEKAEILEKLAGLKRFTEIGEQITQKYKEIAEDKKNIETEISKLEICSEQEHEDLKKSLNNLISQVGEISAKRKLEQEKLNWIESFSKLTESLSQAQKELDDASEKVNDPSFVELSKKLKIRKELAPYREFLKNINEISTTIERNETELDNIAKERVNIAYNDTILRRKIDNISLKILELKTKQLSFSQHKALIEDEKNVLSILDNYRKDLDLLDSEKVKKSQLEGDVLKEKKKVAEALKTFEVAEKSENKLREENETLSIKYNNLQLLPHLVFRKELYAWRSFLQINTIKKELDPLKEDYTRLLDNYSKADEYYKHLELSTLDAAKSLRAKLKIGDNCPVCNSKIKELVPDEIFIDILKSAEQPRQEAKRILEENEKRRRDLEANIRSLIISISTLGIDITNVESTEKTIKQNLASHFNDIESECIVSDQIKQSDEDSETCDHLREQLLDLSKQISSKNIEFKIASESLSRANVEFEKKKTELLNHIVIIENLLNKINTQKALICKTFKVDDNFEIDCVQKQFKHLVNEYQQIENETRLQLFDFENSSCASEKLRKVLDKTSALSGDYKVDCMDYDIEDIPGISEEFLERFTLVSGKLISSKNLRENYELRKQEFIEQCDDLVKEYISNPTLGLTNEESKTYEIQCEKIERELSETKAVHGKIKEDLDSLTKKRPEPTKKRPEPLSNDSIKNPKEIRDSFEVLNEELNALNQNIGSTSQQIKDFELKAKTLQELKEKYNIVRSTFDIYHTLNSYFGEAHFRDVICEYILSHLLEIANIYLKSFSNRYSMFTQPGNLEVMIKDNLSGEDRVFSTLSGGETFMASLALALGLASLQNVKNTPDIFFIDEGFGSLSSECLESVMNTLDTLRKIESRRVGIVSHVESLRDRIPVRISIRRNGTTSNIVTETDR